MLVGYAALLPRLQPPLPPLGNVREVSPPAPRASPECGLAKRRVSAVCGTEPAGQSLPLTTVSCPALGVQALLRRPPALGGAFGPSTALQSLAYHHFIPQAGPCVSFCTDTSTSSTGASCAARRTPGAFSPGRRRRAGWRAGLAGAARSPAPRQPATSRGNARSCSTRRPPPRRGTRSVGARWSRHSPRRQRQRRRGSPGAGRRRAGSAAPTVRCADARSRPAWRPSTSPPPTPFRRLATVWHGCGATEQKASGSRWLWPTEKRHVPLRPGARAPRRLLLLLHPSLSLGRLATSVAWSLEGNGEGRTTRAWPRCTTAGRS